MPLASSFSTRGRIFSTSPCKMASHTESTAVFFRQLFSFFRRCFLAPVGITGNKTGGIPVAAFQHGNRIQRFPQTAAPEGLAMHERKPAPLAMHLKMPHSANPLPANQMKYWKGQWLSQRPLLSAPARHLEDIPWRTQGAFAEEAESARISTRTRRLGMPSFRLQEANLLLSGCADQLFPASPRHLAAKE